MCSTFFSKLATVPLNIYILSFFVKIFCTALWMNMSVLKDILFCPKKSFRLSLPIKWKPKLILLTVPRNSQNTKKQVWHLEEAFDFDKYCKKKILNIKSEYDFVKWNLKPLQMVETNNSNLKMNIWISDKRFWWKIYQTIKKQIKHHTYKMIVTSISDFRLTRILSKCKVSIKIWLSHHMKIVISEHWSFTHDVKMCLYRLVSELIWLFSHKWCTVTCKNMNLAVY